MSILTVCTDYSKATTSRDDRIRNVVRRLVASGVSKEAAQSIVAISGSESSFTWATDALPADKSVIGCDSCTTIVGFEPADGDYTTFRLKFTAASRLSGVQLVHDLQAAGIIRVMGSSFFVQGGGKNPNSPEQHQAFELALKYRDEVFIKNFSIGPTQRYLALSRLVSATGDPRMASTWEDLFQFYMSADPPDLMPRLKYLDHGAWPASNPADEANAKRWLQASCQNGCTAAGAASYYSSRYKGNLAIVMAAGA